MIDLTSTQSQVKYQRLQDTIIRQNFHSVVKLFFEMFAKTITDTNVETIEAMESTIEAVRDTTKALHSVS